MASSVNQAPRESAAAPATARLPWAPIAWFLGLLIAGYYPILARLVHQWATDEDVGHGFFVPVVAGFIVWQRRSTLLALELKPNYWGVLVIVWGALQGYLGMLGAELFLQRTAFIISLAGVLLVMGGPALVRALAFPLLLLPFMVPIPSVIYNQITFPLQLFASRVAAALLGLSGIPVLRDGNILELPSQRLSVVEACSGIRSLLSLSFLSLVYAYFFDRKVWMRWVLLAATIPIAIAANAGRVTITGLLSEYQPDLAQGFFHAMEGWVVFIIALLILVVVHQVIDRGYSRFHRETVVHETSQ